MRHPAWISRVRARTRDSRGAALIEAAIFTPVFFLLVFGVMEIGLAMNDSLAVSSSVKAGARMASATGNEPRADLYTMLNIARESTAINRGDIVRIVIYRPQGFGDGPTESCKAGTPKAWTQGDPSGACNVYTSADLRTAEVQVREETEAAAAGRPVNPAKIWFGCTKPGQSLDRHWCPIDRKVTQKGTGPEYVGVWVRIEHKWVTKIFGNSRTMEDQSVIRLEPRLQ